MSLHAAIVDADPETFNSTAYRYELAALYNVPVEWIELDVSAGSLMLGIKIRAPAGQSIATASDGDSSDSNASSTSSMAAILSRVASITTESLSAALGVNVSITAAAGLKNETITITKQVVSVKTFSAPPGYWVSAGVLVACGRGTFNPYSGNLTASACQPCTSYSTTALPAAVNATQCYCIDGFVETYRTDGTMQCKCPPGYEMQYDSTAKNRDKMVCKPCLNGRYKEDYDQVGEISCRACPQEGAATQPSRGATSITQCRCQSGKYMDAPNNRSDPFSWTCRLLPPHTDPAGTGVSYFPFREDITVVPGYYRVHSMSLEIRRCVGRQSCVGGSNLSTGCALNHVGSNETCPRYTDLCAPGHTGHYCDVCTPSYYRSSGRVCNSCNGNLFMGFLQLLVVCVIAIILTLLAVALKKYAMMSSVMRAKDNDELVKALRPVIEPRVTKHGLLFTDVRPLLTEFKTKQDLAVSISQPKVFFKRVTNAGGPVARKLLLARLRPKLEPTLKKWRVTWEDVSQAGGSEPAPLLP